MRAAAIIVGFNHWWGSTPGDKTFTRHFVHDLQSANPEMDVIVIDNFSQKPYVSETVKIIRLEKRVGYGIALNAGLNHIKDKNHDWIICFNNDCEIRGDGNIMRVLEMLDENTLYGSGRNMDMKQNICWQWSAWLIISKKIFDEIGMFDENLDAAFEDFDYQRRAVQAGYDLDYAALPVLHLDAHTRYEDQRYPYRWEQSRLYFNKKHGLNMGAWFKEREIARGRPNV